MITGIYLIINCENGKMYVGSSIDVELRVYMHCHYLNLNKHANLYLQRAWNKYGVDAFHFCIVEECLAQDLIKIEQLWIDATENKYNINMIAGNCLGKVCSEITKEKIRIANTGKKQSEESKIKRSVATKGVPKNKEHKLKIGLANRKSNKWPHEKGAWCKCRECLDKKNVTSKNYPSYKRKLASYRRENW